MTRLAFSTLACPGWSLEEAIDAAVKLGYVGLELRLLDGALLSADLDATDRRRVAKVMIEAGVAVAAVDTSIRLSEPMNFAELQQYLQMADSWAAPVVRVFPGQGTLDELRRGLQPRPPTGFAPGLESRPTTAMPPRQSWVRWSGSSRERSSG